MTTSKKTRDVAELILLLVLAALALLGRRHSRHVPDENGSQAADSGDDCRPEAPAGHDEDEFIRWPIALAVLGGLGLGALRFLLASFYNQFGVSLDEVGWSNWELALRPSALILIITAFLLPIVVLGFAVRSTWLSGPEGSGLQRWSVWLARAGIAAVMLSLVVIVLVQGTPLAECKFLWLDDLYLYSGLAFGGVVWLVALSGGRLRKLTAEAGVWEREARSWLRIALHSSRWAAGLSAVALIGILTIAASTFYPGGEERPSWEIGCDASDWRATLCVLFPPVLTEVRVSSLIDGYGADPDFDGSEAILLGRPREIAVIAVLQEDIDRLVIQRVSTENVVIEHLGSGRRSARTSEACEFEAD